MSSTTRIRSGNYSCQFWQEHANLIIEYKLKECKSHAPLYRVEEVIGKILNDVWEEIIIIGVLFETTGRLVGDPQILVGNPHIFVDTPRFSMETPHIFIGDP